MSGSTSEQSKARRWWLRRGRYLFGYGVLTVLALTMLAPSTGSPVHPGSAPEALCPAGLLCI